MNDLTQLLRTALWVVVIIVAAVIYIRSKSNHVSLGADQRIDITPQQITSMRNIGEWEFLSISDEEMVDTVRKGLLSDDQLVRIYYGTLRLGIDTRQAKDGWIEAHGDSVKMTLPPVRLLDQHFIDEARTQSFFESGKWTDRDRAQLYRRAEANMRRRCLTRANLQSAEDNANTQFHNMLQAMGFKHIEIVQEKTANPR